MSVNNRVIALADVAEGQWGLFTTAQARRIGLSAVQLTRLADEGAIERLRHGVYRVAGAPSAPEEQVRAAWLAIEPDKSAHQRLGAGYPAVVSHRSAARIHQLGDVDADVIEFTIDRRKQTRLHDIKYYRGALGTGQWTLVGGLPITTVLKTIEDLAADQLDGGHLASVIRDAVTTDRVSTVDVAQALRPFAHKYGARLADGEGLLDRFLKEAGVPQSTRALSERLRSPVPPGFAASMRPNVSAALNGFSREEFGNAALIRAFPQIAAESPALREAMNKIAEQQLSSPEMREAMNKIAAQQLSSPELREVLNNVVAQQVLSPALQDSLRELTGAANVDLLRQITEPLPKETAYQSPTPQMLSDVESADGPIEDSAEGSGK